MRQSERDANIEKDTQGDTETEMDRQRVIERETTKRNEEEG